MSTPLPILKERIEDYLSQSLATDVDQATLKNSMTYSLMAGGKRLRPALTLATIEMPPAWRFTAASAESPYWRK